MSENDTFFSRLRKLNSQYEKLTEEYPKLKELTEKEMLVFEKLLSDKTLAQIAIELQLTHSGVHFHCKNIYKKLDIHSRTQLIVEYKKLI